MTTNDPAPAVPVGVQPADLTDAERSELVAALDDLHGPAVPVVQPEPGEAALLGIHQRVQAQLDDAALHPEPGDRAEPTAAQDMAREKLWADAAADAAESLFTWQIEARRLMALADAEVAAAVAAVRADREAEPLLAKLERWRSEDPGWWATYDEARATTWRGSTVVDEPYASIHAERSRAHAKHGDTSMEGLAVDDPIRLAVLTEEVGEVARELNEGRHAGEVDRSLLRAELIQVGAMAAAWAAALDGRPLP